MTIDPTRRLFLTASLALACAGPDLGPLPASIAADPASNFHAIYDDEALRARFAGFLENVFTLFPPAKIHALVHELTRRHPGDEAIYRTLLAELPKIRPPGSTLTHALPALQKQKGEMARQAKVLLAGRERIDGYLEMGTTGRYHGALNRQIPIVGPVFVLNDAAPTKDPADVVERGQVAEVGTFLPLGTYDPIARTVPDGSLDVVSDLIGLHHCPPEPLDGFVESLRRVLRPNGILLIREHDARDDVLHRIVGLAHDVFNAGIFLPWEENAAQVRGFRSVADWTAWLGARGFEAIGERQLQAGDPTDNALLAFRRA